jgi:PIN domain nuclease of toxin-antitoxin system
MSLILDASALLALPHREPGAERVEQSLQDALVSALDWAEVIQKSLWRRADISGRLTRFIEVGVVFEAFTAEQGEIAVGDRTYFTANRISPA